MKRSRHLIAPVLLGACAVSAGLLGSFGRAAAQTPPGPAAPSPAALSPAAPGPAPPGSAVVEPTAPAAKPSGALSVLLDQARYWRSQGRGEQALAATARALRLDPANADALGLQVAIESEAGDLQAAQSALTSLRRAHPGDPRIAAAEQALRVGRISPAGIAEARRLAQEGRTPEAVAAYRRLFGNGPPPDALALEYYQALSGTEGGWSQARDGLATQVARAPADSRAALAYAEVLTYREATRADGITRLAALSRNAAVAAPATEAWRAALNWLPAAPSSIPLLQAYAERHPDDSGIVQRIEQARTASAAPADPNAQARQRGFAALDANRLTEAEQAFQTALSGNDRDADALGGMGLVRLRQGRAEDATGLLQQAMALDPAHRDRWEAALTGASIGANYASARRLIQQHDFAGAEQALRQLAASGKSDTGLQLMLATALAGQGKTAAAEQAYRAVLAHAPGNASALLGLAELLRQQGRGAEAEDLQAQAERSGGAASAGQSRAERLRGEAQAAADPATRIALLRSAAEADPSNPWVKLDLARAMVASGDKAGARALMTSLADAPRPSREALQAAALFAAESDTPQSAVALLERIPPGARTRDTSAALARARFQVEVQDATLAGPSVARPRLLAMAAGSDPDGSRGSAIAAALVRAGDRAGARQAIAVAMASNPRLTPAARIAYAGALLQAGAAAQATRLIDAMGSTGVSPAEARMADQLRAGIAVQSSDRLNEAGQTADAYDQLAPALARTPDDPDVNMALARLYTKAERPRDALRVVLTQLERDPANAALRHAAVSAAVAAGQLAQARALIDEGMAVSADDPQVWIAAAELARAEGRDRNALEDLRRARDLRRQQLGGDPAPQPVQVAELTAPPANPFRNAPGEIRSDAGAGSGYDTGVPAALAPAGEEGPGAAPPPDPTLSSIDREIASLQETTAPSATASVYVRGRSGSAGLDNLLETAVPLEATFSPGGAGRFTFLARPTLLDAGTATGKDVRRFGTSLFGGTDPGPQTASGAALDAEYTWRWVDADIGSSPLGFPVENAVGGITLTPELAPGWRLRVTGERRAVTDSLLSYAGTTDPRTGQIFGGVTDTRAHAQIEFGRGAANLYAGGGYDWLRGRNVVNNTEVEFGAGGSVPVYKAPGQEVRLGLDLVYFGYNRNLRYFTLGQGGYFSPQQYFAALFPVTYREDDGDLTWSVSAALGYQTYHEKESPAFPGDAALQQQAELMAASDPTIVAVNPAGTQSGVAANVRASLEYRVTPDLRLGGQLSYERSGNWNQATANVFARYVFNSTE